jgi:hypothetical protein
MLILRGMKEEKRTSIGHPLGEQPLVDRLSEEPPVAVETFGGRVHVEWDSEAPVTMLGQLPFFIEYLQVANLFDPFVADCPLVYRSPRTWQTRHSGHGVVIDPGWPSSLRACRQPTVGRDQSRALGDEAGDE